MNTFWLYVLLAVVAAAGLFLLLLFRILAQQALPGRVPLQSSTVRSRQRSPQAPRSALAGQFIELGYDPAARQPAILAETERFLHVLDLGHAGASRTTYLLDSFLWRDIANMANSVLIFDRWGDLTAPVQALCRTYGREAPLIFPDCGYNPLAGGGDASERAERFADAFRQAVEMDTGHPADASARRAQVFIRQVIPLFERAYGQPMTLQELMWLVTSAEYRERLIFDAGPGPESRAYMQLVNDLWQPADYARNLAGLQNVLDQLQLGDRRWLYNQRQAPSLEQALDDRRVIIVREGGSRHALDRLVRLLYVAALQDYTRRRQPNQHPVFVYLDEAHDYVTAAFPDFMAIAQQRRVALHLGAQRFVPLAPFSATVTGSVGTWIVHGGLAAEDAARVAEQIGRRHQRERSVFIPGVPHERPHVHDALVYDYLPGYYPHQVAGLPGDRAIVLSLQRRETQTACKVIKPEHFEIIATPYEQPRVPDVAPPTVWDTPAPPDAEDAAASSSMSEEGSVPPPISLDDRRRQRNRPNNPARGPL